jgi:trk system potassium uptake protein TrkA
MRVLIVGGGKIGRHLAGLLLGDQHQITVVEQGTGALEDLRRRVPAAAVIAGSGTDLEVLERAGVRAANAVAAVTDADETNLVVTSLARSQFQVPRIIARVNDPRNAWLFTPDMGVDAALNQAELMAHLVVEELSLGEMVTLLKLRRGHYSLVEQKVHPQSAADGRALRELDLPARCVLTAVLRSGELVAPRGDTVLQAGDDVLALVHQSQAALLAALLRLPAASGAGPS